MLIMLCDGAGVAAALAHTQAQYGMIGKPSTIVSDVMTALTRMRYCAEARDIQAIAILERVTLNAVSNRC